MELGSCCRDLFPSYAAHAWSSPAPGQLLIPSLCCVAKINSLEWVQQISLDTYPASQIMTLTYIDGCIVVLQRMVCRYAATDSYTG